MTLGFTQQINGKPNLFIEKIWESIWRIYPKGQDYEDFLRAYIAKFGSNWDGVDLENLTHEPVNEKRHTIRHDPHKRWRSGLDIHPVINNRTPHRFQFAPVIKCKSVQRIDIKFPDGSTVSYTKPCIFVDGLLLNKVDSTQLAINDGFESLEAFFDYFKDDVIDGSIIHWTDLKY